MAPIQIYGNNDTTNKALNHINAKGAILIEEESMRILWERNSDIPLPMASTTKIMTCILALEKGNMEDIVTTSKRAAAAPRVKLNLVPGEQHRLEDLLYALMLESSNDAAVAIAEHIGGSVEEFCTLMTQKAYDLGAKSTTFKTPNGLDAPGHASSPYDLALIAQYAYKNPEFVKIINTPNKNIPSTNLKGSRPHHLQNKNRFLNSYEGANGIKTGFTGLAGHCFVGGAKKDGMQLFAVVLGSGWGAQGRTQKYTDVVRLMNYGFENYHKVQIKQHMDPVGELSIVGGEEKVVPIVYGQSLTLPLTKDEENKISILTHIPGHLKAPIDKFQSIGTATIYIDHSLAGTLPIITASAVAKKTIYKSLQKAIDEWINLLYN